MRMRARKGTGQTEKSRSGIYALLDDDATD